METSKYAWTANKSVAVELNQEFYLMLKEEIEEVCNKEILTTEDCIALSDNIYTKIWVRVNFNLLMQFFLQPSGQHDLSPTVVDILCKYCGYNSAAQFIFSKRMHTALPVFKESYLLKYLIRLFSSLPDPHIQQVNFCRFAEVVIKYLNAHTDEAEQFHKGIANNTYGMKCYFERFINIDQLETYYCDGLCLYIGAATAPEQKVFGKSLLCVKYWLLKDYSLLNDTFAEIENLLFDKNDPDVCGAYFSGALLHIKSVQGDASEILDKANNMHEHFKNKEMPINERFELIFCRACLLADCFIESLYYAQYLLECCYGEENPEENDFYQTLLLLKVISLNKMGLITEAGRLFETLKPKDFNFLSIKTDTVLYWGLEARFTDKYNLTTLWQ